MIEGILIYHEDGVDEMEITKFNRWVEQEGNNIFGLKVKDLDAVTFIEKSSLKSDLKEIFNEN